MPSDPQDLARERARWRNAPRRRPSRPEPVGPGEESVWDYPRPPRLERARRTVTIEHGGERVAHSTRALRVCETSSPPVYYVPLADVNQALLESSPSQSFCEWKGMAHYVSLRVSDRVSRDAAWGYAMPDEGFEALRDHLAFYPGRVDVCRLDDEDVKPQPGDYYGGWITHEIKGPFKGDPGTSGW